jgi:Ca-activated chloride channel family protein
MKMMKFAIAWAAAIALMLGLLVYAGNAGKISGIVTDENGEAIPGASIRIEGTSMGAAAGFDGCYVILNVPAGIYKITAQTVGFNKMIVDSVKVEADVTTEVNFKLTSSAIEQSCITVTAEKKSIDKYITTNECKMPGDQLKSMPVSNVNDVLKTMTGFVRQGGQLHARGGRCNENSYMINGIEIRDGQGGNCYSSPVPPRIRINSAPFTTENYNKINENTFLDVLENPLSTFSIDVDATSYSNVRRFLNEGQLPPVDAVRIEELVNYFDYDYPQPQNGKPFSVNAEVSTCPWDVSHKLIHIGLQAKNIAIKNMPPSNIVFLIDVSGSMTPENKLPLLRRAFDLLIDHLRKEDRISIVVYAGAAGLVLPSTHGDQKDKIRWAVDHLQAGGCTAGGAGIKLAYEIAEKNFIRGGNNRVILATDGDFNIGASSDAEMVSLIEQKRKSGVFLSVLGFGEGNLKDSRMEQIADKGNGNYSYIDNIMEANKVLVNEMSGTLFTLAKDVKLQIEFNPAAIEAYRLIGYENRILAKEDFNNDVKDAGEIGAGHSVTALYEIILAGLEEDVSDVDALKYQKSALTAEAAKNDELLTLKIRYKKPDSDKSRLFVYELTDDNDSFEESSDNFKFSAAVAEFGMLLRGSEFRGESNFAQVRSLACDSKGDDMYGYRSEFIQLVETADRLTQSLAGK